jgi:predicted dehydrogenase
VSKLRCGIIGCSWIVVGDEDCHARAYTECKDTELVALCDLVFAGHATIRETKSCFWSILSWLDKKGYADYMDMVKKESLDIVSVCTPTKTHCEIVCAIAPFVKAIYCEKPMASSLEECDRMIEACIQSGTLLQINHQRRFVSPIFRFSREVIDTGTHAFDLLRQLFGDIDLIQNTDGNILAVTDNEIIKIEYIPTMSEHIFQFDCTHSKSDRMILAGVTSLVENLKSGWEYVESSGEDGREALRLALEFKELYEGQNKTVPSVPCDPGVDNTNNTGYNTVWKT